MAEDHVLQVEGLKTCPYDECGRTVPANASNECADCRAQYRVCPRCGTRNRRFATYCRWDGEALPGSVGAWRQAGADARRTGHEALWPDDPGSLVSGFESTLEERPNGVQKIVGGLATSFGSLYFLDAMGNLREVSQQDFRVTHSWPLPNIRTDSKSLNSPLIDGMMAFVTGATEIFQVRLDRPEQAAVRREMPPNCAVMNNGIAPGRECLFLAVRDDAQKCHRLVCMWKDLGRGIRWEADLEGLRIGAPVILNGRCMVGTSNGRVLVFDESSGAAPIVSTDPGRAAQEGFLTFVPPTVAGVRVIFSAAKDDTNSTRQLYRVDGGSSDPVPTPFARLPACGPVGLATANNWVFVQTNDTIYVLDGFADRLDLHMGGTLNLQACAPSIAGSYLFCLGLGGASRVLAFAIDSLQRELRPCAVRLKAAAGSSTPAFASIVTGEEAVFAAREDGYLCRIVRA